MTETVQTSIQRRAVLLLFLTAVLWSLGGLLIKLVNWSAMAIAGMRSAIAAVVLWVYLRRPRFDWSFAQLGGAAAYSSTVVLFVLANKMTTAANAIILQYTAPIYVALFGSWFLGERATKGDWLTILTVMGGMALFFLDDLSPGNFYGNLLAILSGMSFAAMVLFLRKQKTGSPLESVFLGNIITAGLGLPFYFQSPPEVTGWIGLLLLGVFQLGFSYIFYTLAVTRVTALQAVLIPVLEPLLNPVWVLLFIGETPGPWAIIGSLTVLAAVTLRCLVDAVKV
ncbi:MAG TPA: DMT family transporter [Firmicutes bacterium]|nr:DMT family transporter [Bacillota bacterium]